MFFIGNHILPDEDLAAFHWSILGPEHPLASLKVKDVMVISLFKKRIDNRSGLSVLLVNDSGMVVQHMLSWHR